MVLIIIILAIALMAILTIIRLQYDAEVSQIWQGLKSTSSDRLFTHELIADLPAPVQKYFTHAIAPETPLADYVELKMSGKFQLQPNANWLPMEAREIISTLPGFVWQAKMGRGLSKFTGADYSDRGKSRMRFFWWGLIPLVDARNENIDRSASGRLAGEYIWLPSALLPHNGVTWQAIAPDTIQANFKLDNQPINLTLTIDAEGRLLKMSLPRWGDRTPDGSWQYILFGGEIKAEQTFEGYTIPAIVHVGWGFGSQDYWEFFQTNIEQAKFY
jgi:hypothetical protein